MTDMDERTKNILLAVVQSYIGSPIPVGSRYISKHFAFGLSSATIRTAMADLEDMGYLHQPHTSAGRIPTDLGYEIYIKDIIYTAIANDDRLEGMLNDDAAGSPDLDEFLAKIAKILSEYSNYLSLAHTSIAEESVVSRIEMHTLNNAGNKAVVILITQDGVVKHKIIELDSGVTQKDLKKITSYLNSQFRGYSLSSIKKILLSHLQANISIYDNFMTQALQLFENIITFNGNIYMYGFSGILKLPDFSNISMIQRLSKAIEDKQTIIGIIERIMHNDGVQVFVGEEGLNDNNELSLVASRFYEKGRPCGVLGLIGPKRMNYTQAISIINTTAKFVSDKMETYC